MDEHRRNHRHNVPTARDLRERQTDAEVRLWVALRERRLAGLKFRRQHPIGPFVVDFCCPERHLIVELDGGVHDSQGEQDAERERLLVAAGYRVIRFSNEQVRTELPAVLDAIRVTAEHQSIYPSRTPRVGVW